MAPLTFRNSRIVYYGPHPCDNCDVLIAKMGPEWGGTAFTYPSGPVYPNTEWHPHVCDPFEVRNKLGREAREQQLKAWPSAHAMKVREIGYVIASGNVSDPDSQYVHVISHHCSFYDTELAAWCGAQVRQDKDNPTWWMDSNNGDSRSVLRK
jgi:hypothetical protein